MTRAIPIICLAFFVAGCGHNGQDHIQDLKVADSNSCVPIVEAALMYWFASDMPFSKVKSGILRIFSDILNESDQMDIPGARVFLHPQGEYQVDEPSVEPRPNGYMIYIRDLEISGDIARVRFNATDGDYPKWYFVNCKLHRSDAGWTVTDFAGGM